jgi:putative ABC transport system ATP-binding protein
VDVSIAAGQRVAVVGQTGSGKTTFAKLVVRLLDPIGGVVEIGGTPVHRVRFASLRARVGYVPQEGFLFDTSVAENVRYGKPGVNDDAIRLAFADLGLTDWVDSLPDGIHTPVGEGGSHLSAGERQLVALTRAWMSQPDLLVLDEATSAVDPALEVSLRRAIDRLITGRTSITIAHRLSTAEASDEVLVFDRGRLAERGHHRDLVAAGGVYSSLHYDWMAGTRL